MEYVPSAHECLRSATNLGLTLYSCFRGSKNPRAVSSVAMYKVLPGGVKYGSFFISLERGIGREGGRERGKEGEREKQGEWEGDRDRDKRRKIERERDGEGESERERERKRERERVRERESRFKGLKHIGLLSFLTMCSICLAGCDGSFLIFLERGEGIRSGG